MLQVKAMAVAATAAVLAGVCAAPRPIDSASVRWVMEESMDEEFVELFAADVVGPDKVDRALDAYRRGDYRTAAFILEQARALALPDGNLDFIVFAEAEAYRMLKLYRLAARHYSFVMDTFPGSDKVAPSCFRLLQFAYREKDAGRADSLYGLFNARFKTHPLFPSAMLVMGKLNLQEGRFAEGHALLSQIPKTSARYAQAQFIAALCHIELKEWDKALLLLQYVQKQAADPELKAEAAIVIGDIYSARGAIDAALQFYNSVPQNASRYRYVLVKKARVYLDAKKYSAVRDMTLEFIEQRPDDEFFFEMASLLEQAYKGLGDDANAARMSGRIYEQLTRARVAFDIHDELDRISEMERAWQLLELQGMYRADHPLRAAARENLGRLADLRKRFDRQLADLRMQPSGQAAAQAAGSRLTERRYAALLMDSMLAIEDLIIGKKNELELKGYSLEGVALDSAAAKAFQKQVARLDSLKSAYADYEHEYALVLDECLASDPAAAGRTDEDRQMQFVDWLFVTYQNRTAELARLTGESMARTARKDSTGRQDVAGMFSTADRDRMAGSVRSERDRIEAHITRLVETYPKSAFLPHLLMRKAELHYDRASDEFSDKLQAYERNLADGDPDGGMQFPEYNLESVVELYNRILREFPRSDVADDALFYKSLALAKMGDDEGANQVRIDLTKRYPESEYFVEANMNIGRYYFGHPTVEQNKGYTLAEEAFRKVLYYREHPQFVQALYHLGWCYYMQDQYDEAIAVFKYLIEEVALNFDPGRVAENQVANPLLREEAIDYIAISFDEDSRIDDAIKFLSLVGNANYAAKVFKRMGELREEDLDYAGAVSIYRRLLEEYPFSVSAPEVTMRLIRVYEIMNKPDLALAERESFFARYSPGAEWREKVRSEDPAVAPRTDSLAVSVGLFVGDAYYRKGETGGATADFRKAADNYRRVVGAFTNDRRTSDALWNLAVIQDTRLGEKGPAHALYIDYSRQTDLPADRREKAALNAIAIAQQLMPESTATDGSLELEAVKLIEAIDNYVKLFPDGASREKVLLSEGAVFFNRRMFANAAKIYDDIIAGGSKSREYYQALFLLGQCAFGEENWDAAALLFKRVYEESPDKTQRADAYKLMLQAAFLKAKQVYAAAAYDRAAAAFLAIEENYPGSEYSDIVLFNAAEAFEKLEQWADACKAYHLLARKYPGSKLAPDALFNAASDYEKTDDFKRAAETYEIIVSNFGESARAKDALFNLGFCYEKLGQLDKMAAANERYSMKYPGEKDVEAMLLRSAQFYFKAAMYGKARDVYRNFIGRFPGNPQAVECYLMIGRTFLEQDDPDNALLNFEEAEKLNRNLVGSGQEGNLFAAAEAAYLQAGIHKKRFSAVRLTLPATALKEQQKKKTEHLNELTLAYQRVIQYQSEKMFEAAYRIGEAYDELAQAWYDQERQKLDPIKLALFEKELCMAAAALIRKSVVPYRKTLELAQGFDSLGADKRQWVDKAAAGLLDDFYRAGEFMVKGVKAMNDAPVPEEIKAEPLHLFQYIKQLYETLEPLKAQVRDYFLSAHREIAELGLEGPDRDRCLNEFCRVNYMIGNDYDKLAERILKSAGEMPGNLSDDEKEELVFQLEDVVFELQDKAIFAYEDAKQRAETETARDRTWFPKIMEGLARLSPENYGKTYYHTVWFGTGEDWIVRADSAAGWHSTRPPENGWTGSRVTAAAGLPPFAAGSPQPLWHPEAAESTAYFWKLLFVGGEPREAMVYVWSPGPYRLFVNGSLTLSDTAASRSPSDVDTAAGIVSLVKGGDNVVSAEVRRGADGRAGFAAVFGAMIDTSQQFKPSLAAPAVARELAKKTAPSDETPPQAVSVLSGAPDGTVAYKNAKELYKALEKFQTDEQRFSQEMKKERLEFQKLQIMKNAVDVQIKMVLDEIGKMKKSVETMERSKIELPARNRY